jgi:hypothetical protein
MLGNSGARMAVFALILSNLLGFSLIAESARPAPPIPRRISEPIPPFNFLAAERLYEAEHVSSTIFLFTMLNGTSASFYISVEPSADCKYGCEGWKFPLNLELYPAVYPLEDLVITYRDEKYRQISGRKHPIGDVQRGVEDLSIEVSPNMIDLKLNETAKVKVTITTKPTVSYGLYEVEFGTRIGRGSYGGGGHFFLKVVQFHAKLDSKYLPSPRFDNFRERYPDIQKSEHFADEGWFELKNDGRLVISYDGLMHQPIQYGWWEIKGEQILFILPNDTFTGERGYCDPIYYYCDIVLYDRSVWRWTVQISEIALTPIAERWLFSEPFSPSGFCRVEKGWVGKYYNATTYTLARGSSASLRFTIMPLGNFAPPLVLNLSLIYGALDNETVSKYSIDKIKGLSVSFSQNPVFLEPNRPVNVTALFTNADASDGSYGVHFADNPRNVGYEILKMLRDGYRPIGQGQYVLFFVNIVGECGERATDTAMASTIVGSGIALAVIGILFRRRRRIKLK